MQRANQFLHSRDDVSRSLAAPILERRKGAPTHGADGGVALRKRAIRPVRGRITDAANEDASMALLPWPCFEHEGFAHLDGIPNDAVYIHLPVEETISCYSHNITG